MCLCVLVIILFTLLFKVKSLFCYFCLRFFFEWKRVQKYAFLFMFFLAIRPWKWFLAVRSSRLLSWWFILADNNNCLVLAIKHATIMRLTILFESNPNLPLFNQIQHSRLIINVSRFW